MFNRCEVETCCHGALTCMNCSWRTAAVVNFVQFVCPSLQHLHACMFLDAMPSLNSQAISRSYKGWHCNRADSWLAWFSIVQMLRIFKWPIVLRCYQQMWIKNQHISHITLTNCPMLERLHFQCKELRSLDISGSAITDEVLTDASLDSPLQHVIARAVVET